MIEGKLFIAVRDGDLETAKKLIEEVKTKGGKQGTLINTVTDDGWTILHHACFRNHLLVVRWILSSEEGGGRAAGFSKVLAKTDKGMTAMHFAAVKGYRECCRALVDGCKIDNGERAALLNAVDERRFTALHWAAEKGHLSIVQWLLSSSSGGGRAAGFTKVLAKTSEEVTALHLAAIEGHLECCQALVEGCNIENGERAALLNAAHKEGWSVLHFAASRDRLLIIKWLLSPSAGAGRAAGFTNVLARANNGMTSLHVAALQGYLECCQALVEGCMIENGEREKLLNAVDEEGLTVLHWAAQHNHPSIIRWLLSSKKGGGRAAGFNKTLLKTNNGETALHLAAYDGYLECCQALVEGSLVETGEREELLNAVDKQRATALHYAAKRNHPSIIRWLLSSKKGGGCAGGFNKTLSKAKDGSTALYIAAGHGYLECCQALVEGCRIDNGERAKLMNATNNQEFTNLHIAAQEGHPSIIRWLLSSSGGGGRTAGFTKVLAATNEGWNAMHVAAFEGTLECCQALVEGSDAENGERAVLLNFANMLRWTPLHGAAQNNHPSIVKWLLSDEEGGGRAAGLSPSSVIGQTNASVLHFAVANGSLEALNAYLSGCSLYERLLAFLTVDEHGWTVLHIAAKFKQADIIRELLLHHPETKTIANFRDNTGMTALHRAVIGGLDKKGLKEWRHDVEGKNIGQAVVIDALLTAPSKEDEADDEQAAEINPNLGLKIEFKIRPPPSFDPFAALRREIDSIFSNF